MFVFLLVFISQVNAGVKVKVKGSGALLASGGMKTCVAASVRQIVLGISPSTPTPACVSAERVHTRVCGRARSSTPPPAGRPTENVSRLIVSKFATGLSVLEQRHPISQL